VCVQKSKCGMFSFAFSYRYAKTRTSKFCKVVQQHTEGMVEVLYEFCWKFIWLSSRERILKICLTKLLPWVWCTTFLGHSGWL